jgi:hypothetical protein
MGLGGLASAVYDAVVTGPGGDEAPRASTSTQGRGAGRNRDARPTR